MKDKTIDYMSRAPNADVLEEDSERRCLETKSMYTNTTAVCLTVRSTAGEQERVRSHVKFTFTERRGAGVVRP